MLSPRSGISSRLISLTGCRFIAADVNGDNTIDTVDVLAIQQFYLGYKSANVGSYQFVPANRSYPAAVTGQDRPELRRSDLR